MGQDLTWPSNRHAINDFSWTPSLTHVFRFYFVGDEDLLEIIGNSKNVAKLQKHFKKMFAGVSSIILNEDSSVVLGISSREGEEVKIRRT